MITKKKLRVLKDKIIETHPVYFVKYKKQYITLDLKLVNNWKSAIVSSKELAEDIKVQYASFISVFNKNININRKIKICSIQSKYING